MATKCLPEKRRENWVSQKCQLEKKNEQENSNPRKKCLADFVLERSYYTFRQHDLSQLGSTKNILFRSPVLGSHLCSSYWFQDTNFWFSLLFFVSVSNVFIDHLGHEVIKHRCLKTSMYYWSASESGLDGVANSSVNSL